MLANIPSRQIEKRSVAGLHGPLFVGLRAVKKRSYPTKRGRDVSG